MRAQYEELPHLRAEHARGCGREAPRLQCAQRTWDSSVRYPSPGHLSLLHRYSKGYIKRALMASDLLQSEEEYSYLASLISGKPQTKTELNALNAMEKTSGAEIIRRLVAKGLAEERPDERDRRSVLVTITPQGRAELMKVFPQLHTAALLLSAPLQEQQQATLDFLLHYLCGALSTLPPAKSDSDLAELLRTLRAGAPSH